MARIFCNDNRLTLNLFKRNEKVDCIITSPPYDDMRDYNNSSTWNFEVFKEVAKELYDVLKPGGIMVWIVNDKYVKGQRSGTTAKQQLYFQEIGFLLHDVMIWSKPGFTMPSSNRYHQTYEFMLILKKPGDKHTFNMIKDREVKYKKAFGKNTVRKKDGSMKQLDNYRNYNELGGRYNVWENITSGQENLGKKDDLQRKHPATFPVGLIKDHILTWTNEGDVVLDPFMGSGTTGIAALELNREFVGIEIDWEYYKLSKQRLDKIEKELEEEVYEDICNCSLSHSDAGENKCSNCGKPLNHTQREFEINNEGVM